MAELTTLYHCSNTAYGNFVLAKQSIHSMLGAKMMLDQTLEKLGQYKLGYTLENILRANQITSVDQRSHPWLDF